MHTTARLYAKKFFDTYIGGRSAKVADIGAQDVNGSLRDVVQPNVEYVGIDFVEGSGVDIVLDDPYQLPFDDNSLDAVVSSSCFEHAEFFWLLFLEILRVLRPDGLFYLSVPSNGVFHRYPVDCWRFYPDSGVALANWGRRSGYDPALLESFVASQQRDFWNDFVAIIVKDKAFATHYPDRIVRGIDSFTNGLSYPDLDKFINQTELPEDVKNRYFKRLKYRLFPD